MHNFEYSEVALTADFGNKTLGPTVSSFRLSLGCKLIVENF